MQKLYFISCIYDIFENNKEKSKNFINKKDEGRVFVALERIKDIENNNKENLEDLFEFNELAKDKLHGFREGFFVYKDNNWNLTNANSNNLAKREILFNNIYRGKIIKQLNKKTSSGKIIKASEVYTYHINVGHGNCSIIVIKNKKSLNIWMVDCSNFDFINGTNYINNINSCIKHIRHKFYICNFHIDKFFLTHTHFDHYYGINNLLTKKYLTNKTEFWLNPYFGYPSQTYNEILKKLTKLTQNNFNEPITANSSQSINIWHPLTRVVNSKYNTYYQNNITTVPININNSSAVYQFQFANNKNKKISIVFPGDIETKGWGDITKCRPSLNNADYFCISHHGSLNGHQRTNCPASINISNLSQCSKYVNCAILMGRNMAYPGIYNSDVIGDFGQKLIKSEEDTFGNISQFLEIDLLNNRYRHYH
jgi:hypothetical protein